MEPICGVLGRQGPSPHLSIASHELQVVQSQDVSSTSHKGVTAARCVRGGSAALAGCQELLQGL